MTSAALFSAPVVNFPSINNHVSPRPSMVCACIHNCSAIRRTRKLVVTVNAASDSIITIEDPSAAAVASTPTSVYSEGGGDDDKMEKVGARVRVKVPLKVFHVPKVPEFELEGMEGTVKQYVGIWKGKHISANFPYKIEFYAEIEGRNAPVKFFAHLKEDEFEYLD